MENKNGHQKSFTSINSLTTQKRMKSLGNCVGIIHTQDTFWSFTIATSTLSPDKSLIFAVLKWIYNLKKSTLQSLQFTKEIFLHFPILYFNAKWFGGDLPAWIFDYASRSEGRVCAVVAQRKCAQCVRRRNLHNRILRTFVITFLANFRIISTTFPGVANKYAALIE